MRITTPTSHRSESKGARKDRRRNARFPLGLPVGVHLGGSHDPITVELIDLSAGGGRFRSMAGRVQIDQDASFAFLLPDHHRCFARGRVVRADGTGEFALRLEKTNEAFRAFIRQLLAG